MDKKQTRNRLGVITKSFRSRLGQDQERGKAEFRHRVGTRSTRQGRIWEQAELEPGKAPKVRGVVV